MAGLLPLDEVHEIVDRAFAGQSAALRGLEDGLDAAAQLVGIAAEAVFAVGEGGGDHGSISARDDLQLAADACAGICASSKTPPELNELLAGLERLLEGVLSLQGARARGSEAASMAELHEAVTQGEAWLHDHGADVQESPGAALLAAGGQAAEVLEVVEELRSSRRSAQTDAIALEGQLAEAHQELARRTEAFEHACLAIDALSQESSLLKARLVEIQSEVLERSLEQEHLRGVVVQQANQLASYADRHLNQAVRLAESKEVHYNELLELRSRLGDLQLRSPGASISAPGGGLGAQQGASPPSQGASPDAGDELRQAMLLLIDQERVVSAINDDIRQLSRGGHGLQGAQGAAGRSAAAGGHICIVDPRLERQRARCAERELGAMLQAEQERCHSLADALLQGMQGGAVGPAGGGWGRGRDTSHEDDLKDMLAASQRMWKMTGETGKALLKQLSEAHAREKRLRVDLGAVRAQMREKQSHEREAVILAEYEAAAAEEEEEGGVGAPSHPGGPLALGPPGGASKTSPPAVSRHVPGGPGGEAAGGGGGGEAGDEHSPPTRLGVGGGGAVLDHFNSPLWDDDLLNQSSGSLALEEVHAGPAASPLGLAPPSPPRPSVDRYGGVDGLEPWPAAPLGLSPPSPPPEQEIDRYCGGDDGRCDSPVAWPSSPPPASPPVPLPASPLVLTPTPRGAAGAGIDRYGGCGDGGGIDREASHEEIISVIDRLSSQYAGDPEVVALLGSMHPVSPGVWQLFGDDVAICLVGSTEGGALHVRVGGGYVALEEYMARRVGRRRGGL